MRSTFTRGRAISKLALLAMIASVAIGHAAAAAAAAPARSVSDDRPLSEPTQAAFVASSAKPPTLTNDADQPSGGAEWQLAVGIALLALGLPGLVYGLVALSTRRRKRPYGGPISSRGGGLHQRPGPTSAHHDRRGSTEVHVAEQPFVR